MAEAMKYVPDGFPSYLAFKPAPDTVEMHTLLAQLMGGMERKLATSNHLQAQPMMQQMVLPAFTAFYQWVSAAQRDFLEHTHELASYLADLNDTAPDIDLEGLRNFLVEVSTRLSAVDDTEFAAAAQGWADKITAEIEGSEDEEEDEEDELLADEKVESETDAGLFTKETM